MALEKNICGFEARDSNIFSSQVGAAFLTGGTVRSGNAALHVENVNGVTEYGILPVGSVVGVASVIPNGSRKRIRVRCYVRFNTYPTAGGVPQSAYARILSIGGPQNGQVVLWLNGDTNNRAGVILDKRFGLSINSVQNFGPPPSGAGGLLGGTGGLGYDGLTWSPTTVSLGVWYQVTIDADYLAGPVNTTLTASVRLTDGAAFDTTVSGSVTLGGTNIAIGQVAFGNNGGDWVAAVNVDYDDLVYYAADGADAVSQLVLPVETTIKLVQVTGVYQLIEVNAGPDQINSILTAILDGTVTVTAYDTYGLTGPYTNVTEIPVDISGGGLGLYLGSVLGSGTYLLFKHELAASLGIANVIILKVYANGAVSGGGTGSIDGLIGIDPGSAVSNNVTWAAGYGVNGAGSNLALILSAIGWNSVQFDALLFGIRKQNANQQTYLGNILAEVLYN